MKKLSITKETLAELSTDDMREVVGGADSVSCPITYQCVNVSNNCFNSYVCNILGGINLDLTVRGGGC